MREHLDRVEAENKQLSSALQRAIEDNKQMTKKLLMIDQAQESLKVVHNLLTTFLLIVVPTYLPTFLLKVVSTYQLSYLLY